MLTIAGANPSSVVHIPASSQVYSGLVVVSGISSLKHCPKVYLSVSLKD